MKFIHFILSLIILFPTANALNWEWVNPYPTGNCLRDAQFTDSLTGILAGDAGTIIKTTDGGDNWESILLETRLNFTGLYLLDENNFWIVGDSGLIIYTSDGGSNWTVQCSGLGNQFNAIDFYDSLHGCAVGNQGLIYYTQDGGDNWIKADSVTYHDLRGVYLVDLLHGWAVGDNGIILATLNGGISWTQQNSTVAQNLNEVEFFNNQVGWIVGGNGHLLKTTDGGTTWLLKAYPHSNEIRSLSTVDSLNIWAFDDRFGNHNLCRSTDAGESWYTVSSHSTATMYSLSFTTNEHGWIAGDGGYIFHLSNQGITWIMKNEVLYNMFSYYFGDLFFLNDSLGWIVGNCQKVLKTTDGGESFNAYSTETDYFDHIFFTDEDNGCIAGFDNYPQDIFTTNMHSTDGGVSWINGEYTSPFLDIYFISESLGWGASYYSILKTSDLGVNWNVVLQPSFTPISIHFADGANGWTVGENGNILVTTDSGETWSTQVSNTANNLLSVFFLDLNYGYACGDYGKVIKTTNGGNEWMVMNTGISGRLWKIFFLNPDYGWAAGDNGLIIFTSDGGNNWTEEYSRTNRDLYSVTAAGTSYVWAVGVGCTILRADISSAGISEQYPEIEVKNYQINYSPVIGNGIIELEIQISEDGNLKINLYNIAGQDLGEIVNQRINSGLNQLTINLHEKIDDLPNGIYFMNISSGEETNQINNQHKFLLIN